MMNLKIFKQIYGSNNQKFQFNRLLNSEEMSKFTNCTKYEETNPPGNLINKNTQWRVTGSLIKKIQMPENEVLCIPR